MCTEKTSYRVSVAGEEISVVARTHSGLTSRTYSAYHGSFIEGPALAMRHSHGGETHHHPHDGPHEHHFGKLEPVPIMLRRATDGLDEDIRLRLLQISLHQANQPPVPPSAEQVDADVSRALAQAFFAYRKAGLSAYDAEARIRERAIRVVDRLDQVANDLLSAMDEAINDVTDEEIEEITRLGQEQPLDPEDRERLMANVARALQRAGTPQHYFVVNPDTDDISAGPYDEEANAVVACADYTVRGHLAIVRQGYNLNGKVVSPE